jgi:hypothetical protein
MPFNGKGNSMSDVLSSIRDIFTITALVYFTVTFRPLVSSAKKFLVRASDHFVFMEQKVETATNNHLSHIQESLEKLVQHSEK